MSIINIFNKLDIQVDTTAGIYPAVIKQSDKPIGFLNEDLSVSLLKDVSSELEQNIVNAIKFEQENSHLQVVNDEYQMSFFDDTILTVSYNIDTAKEQYNLYTKDGAGDLIFVKSLNDRVNATKEFAQLSGLNNPNHKMRMPDKIKVESIDRFVNTILKKGYTIKDPSNSLSVTDIATKQGNTIGYIDKNNDLIITSNDITVSNQLQHYLNSTKESLIKFPPVIESFRDKLKDIGLTLKGVFKRNEITYNITDENNNKVAQMDNSLTVKFTPYTTEQIRNNIQNIALELNSMQNNSIKINTQIEQVAHGEPVKENLNIDNKLENILTQFTPQEKETLNKFIKVLSENNLLNIAPVQTEIPTVENIPTKIEEKVHPMVANYIPDALDFPPKTSNNISTTVINEQENNLTEFDQVINKIGDINIDKNSLSPAQQRVAEDFENQVTLIKTMVGFNEDGYKDLIENLKTTYGTINANEFMENLKNNRYTTIQGNTLDEKISNLDKMENIYNKTSEKHINNTKEMEL